jgi:arylsulfatase A-like enzyme
MSEQARPNIIWIFGDQHRAHATGFGGDPNVYTPNLDRLAVEGTIFRQAVAGCPLCCPYRGSLLTSRYPNNCVPGHEHQMPPEQPTIAHALKSAGYRTSYFGKWHLDGFKERTGRAAMHFIPPQGRGGFDDWLGYENNNAQWDSWVHGGPDNRQPFRLEGYETDALTDIFIDYLRQRAAETPVGGQPFFAALSVQPPHDPFVAPAQWMSRHTPGDIRLRANVPPVEYIQRRARAALAGYYAQIENLDHNVGRIRAALDETGLADNTYIVFFADHGDMQGSHGQFLKTTAYEESIRVPFIITGPCLYRHKRGERNMPINHVDVAPTTLGLCGIDKPDWMAGTDLSGHCVYGRAVNECDSAYLQLVVPTGHAYSIDRPWRGVVTRDGWKYVCLEHQPWLMFNLNDDPYELANLAYNTAFRPERKRLQDRLAQWIADTGDSFPLPTI